MRRLRTLPFLLLEETSSGWPLKLIHCVRARQLPFSNDIVLLSSLGTYRATYELNLELNLTFPDPDTHWCAFPLMKIRFPSFLSLFFLDTLKNLFYSLLFFITIHYFSMRNPFVVFLIKHVQKNNTMYRSRCIFNQVNTLYRLPREITTLIHLCSYWYFLSLIYILLRRITCSYAFKTPN